jgi:GNAT superfamily N-acetyltransferase
MALAGQGFGLRVAAPGGAILGFALHAWAPNSWTGLTDGTLDTLFVTEAARGQGLSRALLDDLLALARARGWRTVIWHVAKDNAPARALYDRYAQPDGYLRYRVAP